MKTLRLRAVSKSFDELRAVDSVSLEVAAGEFCVLLGPSGCGKSTLLRLVAGLEMPNSGEILIGGERVTRQDPKDRDVAMVFQSYALYPHLSVYENLAFPLRVRRVAGAELDRRVREAAALLRIEGLLARKPGRLSGGQRQRVAIGRAIVRRPKLFLFDEPLSNLDARLRGEMRAELARLHRHLGATTVYVTHDQVEAMTLGTRVALMNEGRFEQVGSPRELYLRPATRFAAAFVGSPSMNLIEGEVRGGSFDGSGLRWPVEAPDGAAALGVRAEDLALVGDGPWRGAVDLVEELGAESLVHVRCGGGVLTVRQREGRSAVGEEVRLRPERVHLFGADGRRIESEPAPPPGPH